MLLAFGPAELPAGRLERLTGRTITSGAQLAGGLSEVRRLGYAVTDEELALGPAAVAAPVHRRGHVAVAAVSISGPVSRLLGRHAGVVGAACAVEAMALSPALGHRSSKEGAA